VKAERGFGGALNRDAAKLMLTELRLPTIKAMWGALAAPSVSVSRGPGRS
jgi:hypothetical protein